MSRSNDNSPHGSMPPDGEALPRLIARMRSGDRQAAVEFMSAYGGEIRRRIRGKLGSRMRRVFDSQEILSTVGRRLDRFILSGRMSATEAPQLWRLIFDIADSAVVDKARIYRRLERVEGEDSEFARQLRVRMDAAERSGSSAAELTIEAAFRMLKTDQDRELLGLWLNGRSFACIAEELGISPEAARKRWQAIREHLRIQLESGGL